MTQDKGFAFPRKHSLLQDRVGGSLGVVAVEQEAMVHPEHSTTLLEMVIEKQQILWDTLQQKTLLIQYSVTSEDALFFCQMNMGCYS